MAGMILIGLIACPDDRWCLRRRAWQALPYLIMPPFLAWGLWSSGSYRFPFSERIIDHQARVSIGASVSLAVLLLFGVVTGLGGESYYFAGTAAAVFVFLLAAHAHHVALTKHLTRRGLMSENVVIVGATPNAERLIAQNV